MTKRPYKTKSGRGGPPNAIDIHAGERIAARRRVLKMTQEQLAEKIGLTFQQVQKYENGTNRVAISRLYDVSQVLGVNMQFFFDEMPADVANKSPRRLVGLGEEEVGFTADPMQTKESMQLVRNFNNIKDELARKNIFSLISQMSKQHYFKAEKEDS